MEEGLETQGLESDEDFEEDDELITCVVCGESDDIGMLYPCHGPECGRSFHIPCAGIRLEDYSDTWICMTCVS